MYLAEVSLRSTELGNTDFSHRLAPGLLLGRSAERAGRSLQAGTQEHGPSLLEESQTQRPFLLPLTLASGEARVFSIEHPWYTPGTGLGAAEQGQGRGTQAGPALLHLS